LDFFPFIYCGKGVSHNNKKQNKKNKKTNKRKSKYNWKHTTDVTYLSRAPEYTADFFSGIRVAQSLYSKIDLIWEKVKK